MKLLAVLLLFIPVVVSAHSSGCHRWHSCPSHSETYVCGDLGYCSQCPDNNFCIAGQARISSTPPPVSDSEPPPAAPAPVAPASTPPPAGSPQSGSDSGSSSSQANPPPQNSGQVSPTPASVPSSSSNFPASPPTATPLPQNQNPISPTSLPASVQPVALPPESTQSSEATNLPKSESVSVSAPTVEEDASLASGEERVTEEPAHQSAFIGSGPGVMWIVIAGLFGAFTAAGIVIGKRFL